ncbi:beta-phosphoglucomutase-like phosphatase (HAD superfamily) [Bradyrhizobium yuanmingense]
MIETKHDGMGRALLFDIDGTLADTDPLHLKAFNQVLGPHGHVFDHARFSLELQGFANVAIGERFLPHEAPERRALILEEKEEVFRTLVAGQIAPLPGLMALLDRADGAGIPMVAVTNAPRLNAELLLSGLGITHRFKALVIGAELPHARQAASAALSGGAAFRRREPASLDRIRGLPHRRAVRNGRRHSDCRHPHQPQPC